MGAGNARRGLLAAVAGLVLAGCGGDGGPPTPVCGTPITSTPTTCISFSSSTVRVGEPIEVTIGVSDLEGDLNLFCAGFGLVGEEPEVECRSLPPAGQLVNERIVVPVPMTGGAAVGVYRMSVNFTDAAGHVSNTATADFEVVVP